MSSNHSPSTPVPSTTVPSTPSRIRGLYEKSVRERQQVIGRAVGCGGSEIALLCGEPGRGLPVEVADQMIENCIGVYGLPLGVGVNLRVDGRDRLVPMVIEEPSVVAALSHGAKLLREGAGIATLAAPPLMIGQLQVLEVPGVDAARRALLAEREALLREADAVDPALIEAGGGARELEVRVLEPGEDDPLGTMLVVHVLVDVRDAMGANAVNSMVEALAPSVARLTGGRVRLRILSNLADRRVVTARGRVPFSVLGGGDPRRGAEIADGIQEASVLAERDPYRAATHNKGIMNGIDAVLLATGQDWRAVEAGAHAYAARGGRYTALSRWRTQLPESAAEVSAGAGELVGELSLPLVVGTVGGIVRSHPAVRHAFWLLRVNDSSSLARIVASCGLAQNLAALRALATEGIQRGHMRLHARHVAPVATARAGGRA